MSRIVRQRDGIALHPREDSTINGVLAALASELVLDLDGEASLTIDLRPNGATGSPVFLLEGSIDGTNYEPVPVFNRSTNLFTVNTAVSITLGIMLIADVSGYRRVRFRPVTAPTAGNYTASLRSSLADYLTLAVNIPATVLGTATAAAGAAVTLTLGNPGTGMFHYITRIEITRFASALLTAGAAPVVITTTNMPGALAFSAPADAAAQGTVWGKEIDFTQPIRSSTAGTVTTIVAPVTTGVIWRISACGYVAA